MGYESNYSCYFSKIFISIWTPVTSEFLLSCLSISFIDGRMVSPQTVIIEVNAEKLKGK